MLALQESSLQKIFWEQVNQREYNDRPTRLCCCVFRFYWFYFNLSQLPCYSRVCVFSL